MSCQREASKFELRIKECPAFVGSTGKQTKGPKILCFNDAEIPLTFAGFSDKKQVSVGLVVVDCLMEGYAKVPYECASNNKYKMGPNPLPLSVKSLWGDDPSGVLSEMECWPYGIIEGCPKDKDDRNEEWKWKIVPGAVLRYSAWADASRGAPDSKKYRESLNPEGRDVIPAFSLLEVEVMCRGWSRWEPGDVNPEAKNKPRDICPVKTGYGISFGGIKIFEGVSTYSVMDKIAQALPNTIDATKARQQMLQSKYPAIKDLLQTDKVSFFVKTANVATSLDVDKRPEMANEPPQIRLSNWAPTACAEASHFIDILQADAMAATNCPDIDSACGLLDLAANAGALSLLVCCNQYRQGREQTKSMLYAYPLVNTRKLLESIQVPLDPAAAPLVDDTGNYLEFTANFQVSMPVSAAIGSDSRLNDGDEEDDEEEEENMQTPLILVSKDPFPSVKGEYELSTPDFMLVGNNVQLTNKSYYIRFVHPVLKSRCILWAGYINLAKPQVTMPGLGYNILAGAAAAAAETANTTSKKRLRWAKQSLLSKEFDPFANLPLTKTKVSKKFVDREEEREREMEAAAAMASSKGGGGSGHGLGEEDREGEDHEDDEEEGAAMVSRKSSSKKARKAKLSGG